MRDLDEQANKEQDLAKKRQIKDQAQRAREEYDKASLVYNQVNAEMERSSCARRATAWS